MSDHPSETAREEVIDTFERLASMYGLSRSYGRMYGHPFFADEPLSLDALSSESSYAKSTVSTAMQTLQRIHVVNRRSLPGEGKKIYYEPETDFWQVTQAFLQQQVRRELDVMIRTLASAEEQL